jgi:hypothetical protein
VTCFGIITFEPWGSATEDNLFSDNIDLEGSDIIQSLQNGKPFGIIKVLFRI